MHQLGALYGTAPDGYRRAGRRPLREKGLRRQIWDDILQQCTTARQALDLLAQMATTKGFGAGAAGHFAIGDPNEVWLFELLGGHHWVAERVPDNAFLAHPNMVTIRQVDLSDTNDFRGWADLVSFAESIGRYDPTRAVRRGLGLRRPHRAADPYDTNRMWGAFNLVAPSFISRRPCPTPRARYGWYLDHKVTRQDVEAICRYHYEGTSLDQTQGYTLMSPHDQTDRPICYATTDYSAVATPFLAARQGGRRAVDGAQSSLLERLRALLRLHHERAGGLDRQHGLSRVPHRGG